MNIFSFLLHIFVVVPFQILGFFIGLIKRSYQDGDWKADDYKIKQKEQEVENANKD